MGLNDQVKGGAIGGGDRKFIFKDGVPFRHMTGKDSMVFRVMPAFDTANPDPGSSYVPFVLPDGTLTDWAVVLHITRFVGHGKGGGGSRKDLLSPKSFNLDAFCPLDELYQAISSDQMWSYLTEDVGEGKGKIRAAYGRVIPHLVTNILDLNQPTLGVQLGVFNKSATDSVLDGKKGLAFQRNNLPQEVIAQNYLLQYAVGDLTDPNSGPALTCQKGNENGEFSKYAVTLALDANGGAINRPIDQSHMLTRKNMGTPADFINIPSEEDLVNELIMLLNGRGPSGIHEHALLKLAFPQFKIPDPPAAPAGLATVAAGGYGMQATAPGFGAPPAAPAPVASVPVTGAPIPGMAPSAGGVQGVAPVAAPAAAVPVAAPIPAAPVAPAPAAAPVPAAPAIEAQGAVANMAAAAVPATPAPAVAPAAPAAPAVPAAPAAVAETPAAGETPAVPGAPVGEFNQKDFLDRVGDMAGGNAPQA